MEELIKYIESRYAFAQVNDSRASREIFMSQAYGALDFYQILHPELEKELISLWENTYCPKFNALVFKAIR